MKALEILKQIRGEADFNEDFKLMEDCEEVIKELEQLIERIECLEHNCEVKEQYNNTAYKNYKNMVEALEATIKALKDERANMTKTHAKNISNLQATIEAKEIIIKDKSAIIEAMAQPKTCDGCKWYGEKHCKNTNSIAFNGDNAVYEDDYCKDYEPKAQP